jgi:hypothetical protein
MGTLTIRKNFKFDKEMVDKVANILQERNLSFTQFLSHYFQAVIKDPVLIDTVERKSKQRTGNFIGILDGKIGNADYKDMKKSYNENLS